MADNDTKIVFEVDIDDKSVGKLEGESKKIGKKSGKEFSKSFKDILSLDLKSTNAKIRMVASNLGSAFASAGAKAGKLYSKNFSSTIKSANVKTGKLLTNAIKKPIDAISSEFAALGAAIATGFVFKKAIDESTKLQNALIGVNSVANAYGISTSRINEVTQDLASSGLIPLQDVTDSLKNLIVNFNGDLEKSVEVFNALTNAAAFNRQGTLSLGEAVRGASEGLKNDLSIKVDNAGITKNLSNLQKEYAASIGTSIGKLTEAQKAQAEYVGILKESRIFQGDFNKLVKTFSGATSLLSTSFKFLLASIGDLVTTSPTVIALLNTVSKLFQDLTLRIKNTGQQDIRNLIVGIAQFAAAVNKFVIAPLEFAIDVLKIFFGGINTGTQLAIVAIAKVGNALVQVFNDVKTVTASLVSGFGGIGKALAGEINSIELPEGLTNFLENADQSTTEVFKQNLDSLKESIDGAFGFEASESVGLFFDQLLTNIQNVDEPTKALANSLKKVTKETSNLGKVGAANAKLINKTIGQALTKTASQGIQALTKSLLLGQDGFANFGKAVAGILGDLSIQLGEQLILSGIGIEALKSLGGAAAIAAGAGLIALGTILKSFAGGAGGAGAPIGGAGGGVASTTSDTEIAEEQEREEPETRISLTIQGDVLDSDESGLKILELLNKELDTSGSVITGLA